MYKVWISVYSYPLMSLIWLLGNYLFELGSLAGIALSDVSPCQPVSPFFPLILYFEMCVKWNNIMNLAPSFNNDQFLLNLVPSIPLLLDILKQILDIIFKTFICKHFYVYSQNKRIIFNITKYYHHPYPPQKKLL